MPEPEFTGRFSVVGNFYTDLADRLVGGAKEEFARDGISDAEIDVRTLRFLAPSSCRARATRPVPALRRSRLPRRGDPWRDRPLRLRLQRGRPAGIQNVQLETGVPCGFGVLTVDNMEQAPARAGAAESAIPAPTRPAPCCA